MENEDEDVDGLGSQSEEEDDDDESEDELISKAYYGTMYKDVMNNRKGGKLF